MLPLALCVLSSFGSVSQITWHKTTFPFNLKKKFQLAENLRSARCSPSTFSQVLAARKTNLITACARKSKRTARMLANDGKNHWIPLIYTDPIYRSFSRDVITF